MTAATPTGTALDCAAVQTVMVGDDIAADVRAAQDAGMRGVLV
jgi:ribonucleotide monophosphatase NagD (HAD superfamily)